MFFISVSITKELGRLNWMIFHIIADYTFSYPEVEEQEKDD